MIIKPRKIDLRMLALCACSTAGAQPAVTPETHAAAPVSTELRLSGDLELSRLVELVSERLGVSVQYQASDLNRRVTLRLREALSDAELWSVLVSTLESQGLAIAPTEAPRVYRVTQLQQALAQGVPLRLDAPIDHERPRDLSSVLTTIVRVRHLDPARAADAVKPLLSQQAVARPVADGSGLLLLADARSRVEQALSLLADPRMALSARLRDAQRSLAATRAAAGLAHDRGESLIALLATWPQEPVSRVDELRLDQTSVTIRGAVRGAGDAERLANLLANAGDPEAGVGAGQLWTVGAVQTSRAAEGYTLSIVLRQPTPTSDRVVASSDRGGAR